MNTRPFRVLVGLACFGAFLLASADVFGEVYRVYFGTYTGGPSKGIYLSQFDTETGKATEARLVAETPSPSFLAIHPSGRFLYAVNELGRFEGRASGAVSAFAVDPKTGDLTLLNQRPSEGAAPCHLAVDRAGRHVLVANYTGGNTAVFPIGTDGRLDPFSSFIQHEGSSVNKARQKEPHAHAIGLDRSNRFAFVADLGIDKLLVYHFDREKGQLTPNDPPFAALPPGSGPRHFAIHPNQRFIYVINEINCTVTAFTLDSDRKSFQEIQTITTLPEPFKQGYSTAEIFIHPSGKFLYGSNRGHNSIAVFSINTENGKLTSVQNQPTLGRTPRSFNLDPTGQYLFAANQDSHSVVLFKVDAKTGRLQETGEVVEVPKPVCVLFVPEAAR